MNMAARWAVAPLAVRASWTADRKADARPATVAARCERPVAACPLSAANATTSTTREGTSPCPQPLSPPAATGEAEAPSRRRRTLRIAPFVGLGGAGRALSRLPRTDWLGQPGGDAPPDL